MAMSKDTKSKIKVRFFEVEVEGGDNTLLEAVKSAVNIANRGSSNRVVQLMAGRTEKEPAKEADAVADQMESEPMEAPSVDNGEQKPRKRAFPVPKLIEDVDLKSGEKSLEAFCKEANPTKTIGKYLTVTYWFKKYRDIDAVGIDHIYTGFRVAGWGSLPDMGQPFRDGKRADYFKAGPDSGLFSLTHLGIDAAEKVISGKTE